MDVRSIDPTEPGRLTVFASRVQPVTWKGRRALCLQDGLALVEGVSLQDGAVEVDLCIEDEPGADGPCSAGMAFRAADRDHFELVLVRPHCSGQPDAVQYSPVFNGVQTWQIFSGPRYQAPAEIPVGRWVTLRLDVTGSSVAFSHGPQPLLVIRGLAHETTTGGVGLWTSGRACVSALRLDAPDPSRFEPAPPAPSLEPGTLTWWWLDGHGPVEVEENGVLNLNRYLRQADRHEATLYRDFWVTRAGTVALRFGFSDQLDLFVDARRVFSGAHRHAGFDTWRARGYVEPGMQWVRVHAAPGRHVLVARLKATEPFGWGIVLALCGEDGAEVTVEEGAPAGGQVAPVGR